MPSTGNLTVDRSDPIRCLFWWRRLPYGDPVTSLTGELMIVAKAMGIALRFSFDVKFVHAMEVVTSALAASMTDAEAFVEEIVVRKQIGGFCALPYVTIRLPYDPDRYPAKHDLLHRLISEFIVCPGDLTQPVEKVVGTVKPVAFSFPVREFPVAVLREMSADMRI